VETIRDRADNHRDRKCREIEDKRDGDFKIKQDTGHKNSKTQNPDRHGQNKLITNFHTRFTI